MATRFTSYPFPRADCNEVTSNPFRFKVLEGWVVVGHLKELKGWMDSAVLVPELKPVATGTSMIKAIASSHDRP